MMKSLDPPIQSISRLRLRPTDLAEFIHLLQVGVITIRTAKDILPQLLGGGASDDQTMVESPAAYVARRGLQAISDPDAIRSLALGVIQSNPAKVAEYK